MTLKTVTAEKIGLNSVRLERLMSVLHDEVARKRLPGAVAVVARHGKIALLQSVGQLNPATGEAMHRDARFRIYSMTKPIVSVAAMMLVEEGRLLLADPVAKHLREFTDQKLAVQEGGTLQTQPVKRGATVDVYKRQVEYLARLSCVRHPLRYMLSFYGIIDLLALLPTYLALLVPEVGALIDVRILRLLRVFRVFKLTAYVTEYQAIGQALQASRRKIMVFLAAIMMIVLVMGLSLIHIFFVQAQQFAHVFGRAQNTFDHRVLAGRLE